MSNTDLVDVFATSPFFVSDVTSTEVTFTQAAFVGANYNKDERPIQSVGLIINPRLENGIQWYYYTITFNKKIKIVLRTTVIPGASVVMKNVIERSDLASGISVEQIVNAEIPRLAFTVTFGEGVEIDKCSYKEGDKYGFNTMPGIFFPTANPTMAIAFVRTRKINPNDQCNKPPRSLLFHNKNDNIVPSIFIDFQSLIDGSDIGNTILRVTDDYQYYDHKITPIIPNYTCKIIISNNPKITNFEESCPLIVSVLRGVGNTAWEKTQYLIENVTTNENDIYNFFINLVRYSMLKYLLSRLMYGKFNINYVLNKYDKKFLKDLGHTRFCNFVIEFTDPDSAIYGYNQYFL